MLQPNALVVDTSASMRNYVREILHRNLGFNEIHEAKDADDAIRVMQSGLVIDWIFSSLEMPGQSSHNLLEMVRNGPNREHTRFVMMSSSNENATREIAIRKGAADYLHRPFAPSQLADMVHRLNGLAERRGAERFKITLPCEINIGFDSFHQYGAELADISMTGCRINTSHLKPGSGFVDDFATVTLLLQSGQPLHVEAKIKRVVFNKLSADPLRNTEVAIEFVNVHPQLNEILGSFIDSCKRKSAS